jgi:hypothetical protein
METLFDIVKTVLLGFGGLLILLFVLAFLFGKRVRKQWEYEAEFRDVNGREFGEFEIELSRIDKEEPEATAKLKLQLKDARLSVDDGLVVELNGQVVFEARVEKAGRVLATEVRPAQSVVRPNDGDLCRVLLGDTLIGEAELKRD